MLERLNRLGLCFAGSTTAPSTVALRLINARSAGRFANDRKRLRHVRPWSRSTARPGQNGQNSPATGQTREPPSRALTHCQIDPFGRRTPSTKGGQRSRPPTGAVRQARSQPLVLSTPSASCGRGRRQSGWRGPGRRRWRQQFLETGKPAARENVYAARPDARVQRWS